MIKIVDAVANKDGRTGDSSGSEIAIRNWYVHKTYPWNYLCICTDQEAAQAACDLAKNIAQDNRYGYSQADRLTGPKNYPDAGGDFDCSSFCSFAYYKAGILPKYSYNTNSMLSALKETGKFVIIENPEDDSQARIGALFLRPKSMCDGHGHVAMAINDGSNPYPLIEPDPGPNSGSTGPKPEEPMIHFKGSFYVRKAPMKTAARYSGHVRAGDSLEYLGDTANGWHKVMYNGQIGYVSGADKYKKYIEIHERRI